MQDIHNLICGLSPVPGVNTSLHDKAIKIFRTQPLYGQHQHCPGAFDSGGRDWLRVAGIYGWLEILELRLEGKKRMPVVEFLRGYGWP